MKPIFFFIRCREHLDVDPEQTVMLYGEEHEFEVMSELTRLLSTIHPTWLVEFGHYGYGKEGSIGEAFFAGEEINPGETGGYWKLDGDDVYILTDSADGLDWAYTHATCGMHAD